MDASSRKFKNIDEYIENLPPDVQKLLEQLRRTIHETAPDATEAMSYGMPTFKLNGNLVHFAAFKHHIGFYPTPSGVTAFENELVRYKHTKGAIQFPMDKPLPLDLVRKIVIFRVKESLDGERKQK